MEIDLGVIQALFGKVFGIPGTAFDPKFGNIIGDNSMHRSPNGIYGAPYYAKDLETGRQYYMPITVTYTNGSGELVTFSLPFPVVGITMNKHVIDTELTERRGKVSELINMDNYKISIKGFCINQNNELPEDDVQNLRDLGECNVPFSIKNVLTDIFLLRPDRSGSDQVTIRNMELPFEVGVKHVKAYSMELMSDEPFSLIELSGK